MSPTQHIHPEVLARVLQSDGESEDAKAIGNHLHHCSKCREAFESLAANSEVWENAPELFRDSTPRESAESFKAAPDYESKCWDREFHWDETNASSPSKHPELLGRLGKYDIEREVGRGGMGVVWKAYDAELNRTVAIKVLAPHLASHATARKRFAQEAVAAAGVLHPNVIAVYGVNNEGKHPYIVMPFIDGPSLQTLVEQKGPLDEVEIVRIALQITSGLMAAHAQGLVHRDIKPANILVDGGIHRVLITDFGLARAEDDASLTKTGWLMGTPNYMSPEQTQGKRADSRSDLFSLGSLIYFLATGHLPFRAETSLGVLHRIQYDHPTPVRRVNTQISKTLSDVIATLLKKSPDHRFQSAAELHRLLEKHLIHLHQPEIAKPPRVVVPLRYRRLSPLNTVGSVLMLALVATTIGYGAGHFVRFQVTDPDDALLTKNEAQPTAAQPTEGQRNEKLGEAESARIAAEGFVPIPQSGQVQGKTQLTLSRAKYLARSGNYKEAETLLREVLEMDETNDDAATDLGYVIGMQGRIDEARPWYERSAKSADFSAIGTYNLCCYYAQKEEPERALNLLEQAIELGVGECLCKDEVENDSDLASIKQHPRFVSALEILSKAQNPCGEARPE